MPAVLNTNAASLYASKNLQSAQSKMATSVERLSSGLRVNRAKDDAAGLGIADEDDAYVKSNSDRMIEWALKIPPAKKKGK